MATAKLAVQKL